MSATMTINWADDIPLTQQITDVTSTNNKHQSPTNNSLTAGSLEWRYAPKSTQNDIQPINSWNDQYRAVQHMKNKTRNKVPSAIIRKRKEAAALAFTVPSATHAFCFNNFPTRGGNPVSEQRKNLKMLGIDNSRILDMYYPDTNVVGFPIYNDYEYEIIEIMKKSNLEPNTKFDPHNPTYLKDQKYKDLFR
ncbi:hypothetical protein BDA99DRAFT_589842 [Phascolomyces articulosus]|uniref:Uncharacterized protein n=1 Tax=Phascolomyces articulosus TaxID=60185 RepID=A0AAD5P9K4_9FUNG|nr:hypothetical protein BDA99DRAFT_589842 [Phascolomyces articulosus]